MRPLAINESQHSWDDRVNLCSFHDFDPQWLFAEHPEELAPFLTLRSVTVHSEARGKGTVFPAKR